MTPAMPMAPVVAVDDDAVAGAERALDVVEGLQPLARRGPSATRRRAAGHLRQVVGVVRLAQLEHHVVGDVDHVVDGPHARSEQALGHPRGRRPDLARPTGPGPGSDRTGRGRRSRPRATWSVAGARLVGASSVGHGERHAPSGRRGRGRRRRSTGRRAGSALTSRSNTTSVLMPSASVIGVPGARLGGQDQDAGVVVAQAQLAGRAQHPVGLTRRASCALAISMPPGITVPTVASGTRSPATMLKAPQQICSASPSPASTSTSWIRSASGCGPQRRAPGRRRCRRAPRRCATTDSTSMPRSAITAICSGSPSIGANSEPGAEDLHVGSQVSSGGTVMSGLRTAPGSGCRW